MGSSVLASSGGFSCLSSPACSPTGPELRPALLGNSVTGFHSMANREAVSRWHYYLVLIAVYEFLPMLLALSGAILLCVQEGPSFAKGRGRAAAGALCAFLVLLAGDGSGHLQLGRREDALAAAPHRCADGSPGRMDARPSAGRRLEVPSPIAARSGSCCWCRWRSIPLCAWRWLTPSTSTSTRRSRLRCCGSWLSSWAFAWR